MHSTTHLKINLQKHKLNSKRSYEHGRFENFVVRTNWNLYLKINDTKLKPTIPRTQIESDTLPFCSKQKARFSKKGKQNLKIDFTNAQANSFHQRKVGFVMLDYTKPTKNVFKF